LLTEFGLGPVTLALVPLERQVAEKLHVYTRTDMGGGTTRARDLVDVLLIRQCGQVDIATLGTNWVFKTEQLCDSGGDSFEFRAFSSKMTRVRWESTHEPTCRTRCLPPSGRRSLGIRKRR